MSNSFKEYASKEYVNGKALPIVTTTGTADAYEATVEGIDEIVDGMSLIVIPHINNNNITITLNVNGLGARRIYLINRTEDALMLSFKSTFLYVGTPYQFTAYDDIWIVESIPLLSADNIRFGILPISQGGTGYNRITDTTYTTARYRASALVSTETTPVANGVINWIYE